MYTFAGFGCDVIETPGGERRHFHQMLLEKNRQPLEVGTLGAQGSGYQLRSTTHTKLAKASVVRFECWDEGDTPLSGRGCKCHVDNWLKMLNHSRCLAHSQRIHTRLSPRAKISSVGALRIHLLPKSGVSPAVTGVVVAFNSGLNNSIRFIRSFDFT